MNAVIADGQRTLHRLKAFKGALPEEMSHWLLLEDWDYPVTWRPWWVSCMRVYYYCCFCPIALTGLFLSFCRVTDSHSLGWCLTCILKVLVAYSCKQSFKTLGCMGDSNVSWSLPERGGYLTKAFLEIYGLLQYVFRCVLTYVLTCYVAGVWYDTVGLFLCVGASSHGKVVCSAS